jgi:hypothetical protein
MLKPWLRIHHSFHRKLEQPVRTKPNGIYLEKSTTVRSKSKTLNPHAVILHPHAIIVLCITTSNTCYGHVLSNSFLAQSPQEFPTKARRIQS